MNTKVVYHSSTGNTRKLAVAIAEAMFCEAEELGKGDVLLNPAVDLMFIGDGTYYGHPDANTVLFICSLDPSTVKNVALFATCGDKSSIGESLKGLVVQQGLSLVGEPFVCKGEAWGRINKRRPNKTDIENAQEYARTIRRLCGPES
ncbi:hypothetical protein LJC60_03900 [Ruminococcaceae bacterium OttesenSCG-928-D13]|nr:hypothetical protein [Ruminococcaceae bacterium OttesenSCG-928-D13]